MASKKQRSSRTRMKSRVKRKSRLEPTPRELVGKFDIEPNRARRRIDLAAARGAPGRSARQLAKAKRKARMAAVRHKMRKAIKKQTAHKSF